MSFKKLLPIFFVMLSFGAKANYMLVQNVTKVGNNPINKTMQIQFDLSWQNSWRDSINWDAAWIFIKFKDASGLWQHARLNLLGYVNGAGTTNTIKVASDSVGAFVYRDVLGSGNFNATSMQLQWNYGASGLTDVSALEVRVFATEMVYVPEGGFPLFNIFDNYTYTTTPSYRVNGHFMYLFYAPGKNYAVINQRLSPTITISNYNSPDTIISRFKIKGNAGIDLNNDGIIDAPNYPTGYPAFYMCKYEISEQMYSDFLNTLTNTQINKIGYSSLTGITTSNGTFNSIYPNRACGGADSLKVLSLADWSGMRIPSIFEYSKACYGPLPFTINSPSLPLSYSWATNTYKPINSITGIENGTEVASTNGGQKPNNNALSSINKLVRGGIFADQTSNRETSGSSYYGIMELSGNAYEPTVRFDYPNYTSSNGNGQITSLGYSDVIGWSNSMIQFNDYSNVDQANFGLGFRYVRSAE